MGRVLGTAAVLAAVLATLAGGLGLAGAFDWRLDIFAHFAPGYLVVGRTAAAVAGLVGRPWRAPGLALGLLAILAGAGLMAPEYLRRPDPPPAAPAAGQLRIVQFNAFKRNVDLPRVIDWLVAQNPDIVTMQEARHDLRDALIRRTGWHVAGGKEHVMIFSRADRTAMVRPRLRKSPLTYVNATYPNASGPFEVVTVHFAWPTHADQPRQFADLAKVVGERPRDRMILTGDFNSAPWSHALQHNDRDLGLTRRDKALFSFPTRLWRIDGPPPMLPIDHVYAGPGWRTVSVTRGPNLGSDHYPLLIVLAPAAPR